MKKLFYLLIAITGVACNPVKGKLNVKSAFTVNIPESEDCDDQFDWWNCNNSAEKVTIQQGSYSMSLKFKAKNKVDLEIKLDKGKVKTIPIELAKGKQFPEYYGSVDIKGKDMQQNFDLVGDVDTEVTESDIYNDRETCTKAVERRVCKYVSTYTSSSRDSDGRKHKGKDRGNKDRRGKHRGERVCEYKTEYIYGKRSVEYYYRYTQTDVDLDFLSQSRMTQLAKFRGGKSDSEKIYTYQGHCRIH